MKALLAPILFVLSTSTVLAAPPQPSNDPSAVKAIKQLEQDMGEAMVRGDLAKLSEIYADDFATVGSSGKVFTKKDLLADFESFHNKLESFENGPIDVQVFGNVAVAHGGVSEKRLRGGKDVRGNYVWMDLLENRNGKWVVVRTAGVKVDKQVSEPVSDGESGGTSGGCAQRHPERHFLLVRM
jgi:ketosteroid isomerase-like protein